MVTQVSYPGVYIEEVPSGVHTITSVSTSVAAFFGQTLEGPINKAVRITSLLDFERIYGPAHPDSELSTSVKLFFLNGGTDCYVVRLMKITETTSKASILLKRDVDGTDIFKITAKEYGSYGNEFAVEVYYKSGQSEDAFNVRIYRIGNGGVVKNFEEFLGCTLNPYDKKFFINVINNGSNLVNCEYYNNDASRSVEEYIEDIKSKFGNPNFVYSIGRLPITTYDHLAALVSSDNNTNTKFRLGVDDGPVYEIDIKDFIDEDDGSDALSDAADSLKSKINEFLPNSMQDSINVEFILGPTIVEAEGTNPAIESNFIKFSPAADQKISKISIQQASSSSTDIAKILMLGTENGGIERSIYSYYRPAANGISFKDDIGTLNDLFNKTQDSFNEISISENTVPLGDKLMTTQKLEITTIGANKWFKSSPGGEDNNDGIREKFSIIASEINNANIDWNAFLVGNRLILKKKSLANGANPSFSTGTSGGTGGDGDISNMFNINPTVFPLEEGIDGEAPDVSTYVGSENDHSGFYALDLVDIFNLMVIPNDTNLSEDEYNSLWSYASIYCRDHRAFLIIEPPSSWSDPRKVTDQTSGIGSLRTGVVKDHAAVYFPKLKIRENGILKTVGPGGAIAGLYSRIDSSGGGGVWKAQAGISADLQGGVTDLSVLLTDRENGILNKEGVNCLRRFPSGIVSWGARTMDGADDFSSEWKYVPIRRLALLIEESLYRGTKWVIFEPNDEPLWAKIRLNVGVFMQGLFRQGAFQGSSPDKAFFVKCDGETTTQADRNLGIVNILVGFAPLKPAEFVIIKIQQMIGDL